MTGNGDDGSFLLLADVVARVAEVVRQKRRLAASAGLVVDLDATPNGPHATVASLAVLVEAGVVEPATGTRLLRRALAAVEPDTE